MRHTNLICVFSCAALFTLSGIVPIRADDGGDDGHNRYVQHNLVSDLAGMATRTDTSFVNPWGIDRSPTGPWWVNANGTGLSIVLDAAGNPAPAGNPIVVTIPPPPGSATSAPTGIAANGTMDFLIEPAVQAIFLFVTEDGSIAGWNPTISRSAAVIKVPPPPGAVYKGMTLGQMGGHNVLYVANFGAGTVDVFDAGFGHVTLGRGAFQDTSIPAGFAPFNVQNIDGSIFVTFAKQDDAKHDDVPGPGLGYVDRFSPEGVLMGKLEHGAWMNSPWAVAKAPGNFGKLSNRLLVGNFGSGQIAAFNLQSGKFQGMMRATDGSPLSINGLWGLKFGNDGMAGPSNVLFFAAGIQDEAHGLFGTLTPGNGETEESQEGDHRL